MTRMTSGMSFHDLHQQDAPLLLPNAWDVPSALAFVNAGFAAVGTTSFGVASGAGRPDGARASEEPTLRLAAEMVRLGCHVTLDIEDGYADDPERVADFAARLGVAGVNIEDSTAERLVAPEAYAAKAAAVKRRCPGLFLNARVDTYWLQQDATVEATLARAAAYVAAGADGVFVPGVSDPELIRTLAAGIDAPLNVLAVPGMSLGELGALGVRRVSTGSLPYRAAMHAAAEAAVAVRDGGAVPAATPYDELQARLVHFAG
jgi:2-methylisocitrate lyase-like PEP mutase family enzyme